MRNIEIIIVLCVMLLSQGCGLGILAAGIGTAVYAAKSGDAQQTEADARMLEVKTKYQKNYNEYCLEMERINMQREKAALKPRPILSMDEWIKTQTMSPEEAKLFGKKEAQPEPEKEVKAQEKIAEKSPQIETSP